MVNEVIGAVVGQFVSKEIYSEEWDLSGLLTAIHSIYPSDLTKADLEGIDDADVLMEKVLQEAIGAYEKREQELGEEVMRELERMVLLSVIDNRWREHLAEMDYLQEGIHLRAYGQRDPLVEYQREALEMFEELKGSLEEEFVRYIYRVEIVRQDEPARPRPQRVRMSRGREGEEQGAVATQVSSQKIPRNAPCPCGSGKKYKKCHGLTA
jgi:preprotein translocase subunit SecA